jgi:hypothetical protein
VNDTDNRKPETAMLKFITKLFATPTVPSRRTQLGFDVMEDRYAPTLLVNPGLIRGFNPQPDPPRDIIIRPMGIGTSPSVTVLGGGWG